MHARRAYGLRHAEWGITLGMKKLPEVIPVGLPSLFPASFVGSPRVRSSAFPNLLMFGFFLMLGCAPSLNNHPRPSEGGEPSSGVAREAIAGAALKAIAEPLGRIHNSPVTVQAEAKVPKALLTVNSIYVQPVQLASALRSAVDSAQRLAMNSSLNSAAREELSLKLVFPSGEESTAAQGTPAGPSRTGDRVATDTILSTTLLQYTELQGSRIGAERPATVDFQMKLLRVGSNQEIWSASYHVQDKALNENIYDLDRRLTAGKTPQWRTAGELLRDGYRLALRDLNLRREGEFLR